MNKLRKILLTATVALLPACAGFSRGCSSSLAENFGADWVVVQLAFNGQPFRCWALTNVSITNEPSSDGIYWKDTAGNLVHISGLYNRVQVINNQWPQAYQTLGLTEAVCKAVHDGTQP